MKRLLDIFSKRRGDEHEHQSQEKKENLEAKSNSNESSHDLKSHRGDLFGDDSDLGYC
jgi:hypothetical protein